ncbi:hypothetical protein [Nibribacter koreensis]|uniref:Uncharacterized protein n=1 Tax=Nibribacter koreensis TaxID=1084519 RepID=A0ABP8FYB7_9BACT
MDNLISEALESVQEKVVAAKAICSARIKEIEDAIDALVVEKNILLKHLQSLESVNLSNDKKALTLNINMPDSNRATTKDTEGYNRSWPWALKIQFVLSQTDRKMSPKQIVEEIFKFEPELRKSKSLNSITSVISARIKRGALVKYPIDGPNESSSSSYLVGLK